MGDENVADSAPRMGADKRAVGFSVALGAVLAFTMWLMVDLILFREMPALGESGYRGVILWGATGAVFAAGAGLGYLALRKLPYRLAGLSPDRPWRWLPLDWSVRSIALAAVAMLVLWAPYIVVQFPAGMNFDTYVQIYQYLDPAPTYYDTLGVYYDAEFVDHHPVFDTLVYGTLFWIGSALGSQNMGLFMAALFQTALSAGALAAACCYLARLGVPKAFRIVSLAFCALFPYIPLWSMTLMKDAFQAPLFVAYFICFIEAFQTRGAALRSSKWLVCIIVFGCLSILTKKTGMAVVIPSLLVLAVYCSDARKRALAAVVCVPLACFGLFPLVVYPAIGGVHPGGTQEGVGFAMQQVMTVMATDDDLSDDERSAVARVLDIDAAVEGYSPGNIDQVKNKALSGATREDYLAFFAAYFSTGLRHPLLYTASSLSIAAPYYAPGAPMTYYGPGAPSKAYLKSYAEEIEADGIVFDVSVPEQLSGVRAAFGTALDAVKASPLGRFFLARGLYGGWVPIVSLFLCLYCDRRYAVAFAPVLLYMATLLICPVVSSRYMLSLLHVAPLMLGLACGALRSKGMRLNGGEGADGGNGEPETACQAVGA